MKKIINASVLSAMLLLSISSYGQGYFDFVTGKSQAYDGFTTAGVSALSSQVTVSFLWAAASTAAVGLPLTSTPITGNSTTVESYTTTTAWAAILASGFTPAVYTNISTLVFTPVAQRTLANGGVSFNGGASFGVVGTAGQNQGQVSGVTYSVFLVGWGGGYANIAAAAAAGAAVGWSSVFQYTSGINSGATVGNFSSLSPNFGVFTPAGAGPVPEPSTMALAALGGASLLLFRRRK